MADRVSDVEDMAYFDRLPRWAREAVAFANRKFSARELLPAVEGGSVTPFNIRAVMANAEMLARNSERRAQRNG